MAELQKLFDRYDKLVIFDTETTGLWYDRDEIIEFAAVTLVQKNGETVIGQEYDELVALSPGRVLPPKITELTGITMDDLRERGISKAQVCQDIGALFSGERTLLLAYNAHFDLCFLFYTLKKDGNVTILKGKDKLDILTVYRDRKAYPHRLENAIEAYGLSGKVHNSHRAIDDVKATVEVLLAMERERDDLEQYVNIFGYLKKYGISGKQIASVTYRPQYFQPGLPVYADEAAGALV